MDPQCIEIAGNYYWFTDGEPEALPSEHSAVSLASVLQSNRSSGWHKLEVEFIKAHPTCIACGGKRFLQVHHVRPFHLFPDDELKIENLRTLCMAPGHACHLRIGHAFDWRAYNPHCDEDAALSLRRILQRHYQ